MRTVGVRLVADVSAYSAKLKQAGGDTKDFLGELDKSARKGNLDAVADKAGMAGLALTGMAAYAIKSAADFDKSMSAVSAATHASAGDIEQLRRAAIQAGKDTQYSATEAADGITELSKAGVSTADVLGGGLKGALALAAAGQIDVADAAETAASAMTQFKLKGDQIPHIADLLAAGAGKAQGSVADMAAALNQAGLIAGQTGLSIEDTTGTLAAFANAGLIGSDAGTSFKTMLQALQAPSGKTKDLMDELGISAYDAQGNFVGITALAGQLKTQLGKLTPELRANALAQIFGSDATRAASVLYEQGAVGIQTWIDKTNDAGYAASTAAKLTDNLAGDLERLKGSLETLAIEGGSGANSGLRVIAKSLNALVDQFGQLNPAVGGAVTILTGLSGVALLAAAGWVKYRRAIADVTEQLNASGPAGEKAAVGLEKTRKAAAAAVAVFLALEVAGAVFDAMGKSAVNVDRLTDSLTNYINTGKAAGELTSAFGDRMEDFKRQAGLAEAATHGWTKGFNDFTSTLPGVGSMIDSLNESLQGASFNSSTDAMAAYDQALTAVFTSTNDAKQASQLWNDTLIKSGLDTDQLAKLLPNAYKKVGELNAASMAGADAMGGMAVATGDATVATKEYKTEAEAAAGAAKGEADALVVLSERLKAQANPVFALIGAEKDLASAKKASTEAIQKYGRNSDQAKEATQKLALAAIALQGASGALGNSFNGKLTPSMIATLKAADLTKAQIADVAGQFKAAKRDADAYDGKYAANVKVNGAGAARSAIRSITDDLRAFDGKWTATMITNYKTFGKPGSGGGLAGGGPVFGPGTGTSDSVEARLSNGEHVWTAREVTAAGGHGAVAQMRASVIGGPVRFADGGAASSTRVMPASAGPQRVVVETRNVVEFAGGADAFGALMLNALRVKPGLRATMATTLRVKKP